jgi:hypothetical protein
MNWLFTMLKTFPTPNRRIQTNAHFHWPATGADQVFRSKNQLDRENGNEEQILKTAIGSDNEDAKRIANEGD